MSLNRAIVKLGKYVNSGLLFGCHSGNCKHLCTLVGNEDKFGKLNYPKFNPNKVVILSRITRYEFEKLMYKDASEEQFKQKLKRKRSDYRNMLERHKKHYSCLENMTNLLRSKGIETKVVKRPQFTSEVLDWADAVFTAGGDGTFLDAASKILNIDTPIIGVNTDPTRSEGRLCLPKQEYSALNFDRVLERLLSGDFKWKWRQRIRITMSGYHANDEPIELSNQQLQSLEHRYTEHVQENEMLSRPVKGVTNDRVLPVRALNEVFFGESCSSRLIVNSDPKITRGIRILLLTDGTSITTKATREWVSYYELSIDNMPGVKQKSSGVTVCTVRAPHPGTSVSTSSPLRL